MIYVLIHTLHMQYIYHDHTLIGPTYDFTELVKNTTCSHEMCMYTDYWMGFQSEYDFSVCSKALADYSKDFVVSVVLGKDLVPR